MSARTKGGELIPTGDQQKHCVTSEHGTVEYYTQIYSTVLHTNLFVQCEML